MVWEKVNVHTSSDPDQAYNKGQALGLKRAVLGRQPKLSFFFPFIVLIFITFRSYTLKKKGQEKRRRKKPKKKI